MSGAFDIVMESRREIVEKIIRMMEQEGFFLMFRSGTGKRCAHTIHCRVQSIKAVTD